MAIKLKRIPDSKPYSDAIARFTVASRNTPDGIEIPVQPVIVHDPIELTLVRSGVITAAGNTILWTPQPGKRVRLRGFSILVDPATTTVAQSVITLVDGANTWFDLLSLAIGVPTSQPSRFRDLMFPGEGLLSSAIDNAIAVNLSAAATAGNVQVTLWGYEE